MAFKDAVLKRLLSATQLAAERGIHVFWIATYELKHMLPHLERLGYLTSRAVGKSLKDIPAGRRYDFLKQSGRLTDYFRYLEEQAYEQGRHLAERWHSINPHLALGIWPLFDNWFSRGLLRGLGGAVPALGLSGVEYYHGSDQTRAMAEYFESRIPNLRYTPGFYPPYAYSVGQMDYWRFE